MVASDSAELRTLPREQGFSCRRCGHCCEGRGGIVVSSSDLERLCAHLRMSPESFEHRWGERRGTKLHIRADEGAICVFFQKGVGCAVHPAKPDICRAWPYFRGNLLDGESLALAKDFCPGISPAVTHADFVREGLAWLTKEHLIGKAGRDEAGALQVADLLENLAKSDNSM